MRSYYYNHNLTHVMIGRSLFFWNGLSVHLNVPAFHLVRALSLPESPPFGY